MKRARQTLLALALLPATAAEAQNAYFDDIRSQLPYVYTEVPTPIVQPGPWQPHWLNPVPTSEEVATPSPTPVYAVDEPVVTMPLAAAYEFKRNADQVAAERDAAELGRFQWRERVRTLCEKFGRRLRKEERWMCELD